MRKMTIALGCLFLVGIAMSALSLYHCSTFDDNPILVGYGYSGKVLLTHDEYEQFKLVVARDDVAINSLEVFN
ncbi:MAG: hypothetical protein PHQ43_00755 [Dehalococcoidales bacterium]|nr:hypothetical protein [Dehalococcoidales bacterium]